MDNQLDVIGDDFIDKLNNSPKWMSRILQVAIDAFWIMDVEGNILEVNNATLKVLGYSKEELLKMNIKDLEADNQQRDYIEKVINEDRHSFEARYICKSGSNVDLEISVNFINDLDAPFLVVFARDITDRKIKHRELEKAYQDNQIFLDKLRKEGNRTNTILQTSMDAFWVMDNQGEILEVNEAFIDLFKYSLIEIMNMNISDLDFNRSKDDIQEHLIEIKNKEKDRFESRYKRKDGSCVELEISATFISSLDEPIFVVFARDITERKRRQRELDDAQKQLMQAEKMAALGRLVAGVAHEINTPLGIGVTVASYLEEITREILRLYNNNQMTRSDLEGYLESTSESTEMVLKNLENASELISKFKQVAVDQTNNEKREIDLKGYLTDILISLKPRLKKSNHTIKLKCSDDIKLYTYPGAISQIVTNLIINSLMHAFAEKEFGEINIELREENQLVELKYKDNGKGIPQENIKKIFEPFFTTKRGQGGTGLGLNLVYNLVTSALGGKVRCKSSSQNGTIFIIEIPKGVMGDG
jgi:PAS domain S-box-containing protein